MEEENNYFHEKRGRQFDGIKACNKPFMPKPSLAKGSEGGRAPASDTQSRRMQMFIKFSAKLLSVCEFVPRLSGFSPNKTE